MNSEIYLASNRNIGFLFAGLFACSSVYSRFHGGNNIVVYSLLIGSIVMGSAAVVAPNSLRPLNKAWVAIGELMGIVVSPLVLGMIFFTLITPVALVTRLFGRDELRLKKINVSSYWIERLPPGPSGDTFKNQF